MNIKRNLAYGCKTKADGTPRAGDPFEAHEILATFGSTIVGSDVFVGINSENIGLAAYRARTKKLIESWIASTSEGGEFTIVLGLEPNDHDRGYVGKACFDYVNQHMAIVDELASDLHALIESAGKSNRTMRCVVRYASEMNVGSGNAYAGFPNEFIETHRKVYEAMKSRDNRIQFSFSPNITNARIDDIQDYWPGHRYVDLVGCTWYWSTDYQRRQLSTQHLDQYLSLFSQYGKPLCMDELGCSLTNQDDANNEGDYEWMHSHLLALRLPDLEHVTYFCAGRWGAGVTLSFL